MAKSYTASDGKLVLTLTPAEEGGFVVTSPLEPDLVTEAETLEEAFRMAHDAVRGLRASRTKLLRRLAASGRRTAGAGATSSVICAGTGVFCTTTAAITTYG
jgi:antitoxin HicB